MKALLIFLLSTFLCLADEVLKTDFIRVAQEEKASYLQTAITHYQKEDQKISLIGAVHIADAAYFQTLNKRFTKYDRLLYEMIGGEKIVGIQKNPPKPTAMHKMYHLLASFLKLSEQKTEIDYSKKNFIHADLTFREFEELQKKRDESLLGFAMDSSKNADPESQPQFKKLMSALLSGDANQVKLQLIGSLGAGDDQIRALAGESVIITDRNTKCLEVLDAQLKEGHKSLGIFYGAAHFPDLEKSLKERGFKMGQQEWLNAWTIPKKE
ncbi:TraB/GumN family protein [bacterium]|nr:TraB/GumN family protein [bacterium]